MAVALERAAGRSVDLVVLNRPPPLLAHEVVRRKLLEIEDAVGQLRARLPVDGGGPAAARKL